MKIPPIVDTIVLSSLIAEQQVRTASSFLINPLEGKFTDNVLMVDIIIHVAFLNEKLMIKSQFGIEMELLLVVAFLAEKKIS